MGELLNNESLFSLKNTRDRDGRTEVKSAFILLESVFNFASNWNVLNRQSAS